MLVKHFNFQILAILNKFRSLLFITGSILLKVNLFLVLFSFNSQQNFLFLKYHLTK